MIVLGVIPARGGSRIVPLKNIRKLCGKPLVAYAIESAKGAQLLSRVVVSTDDQRITDVCAEFDCEVVKRPPELAVDNASTESALIHAVEFLKQREGFSPEVVLTLEPTSPFRTSKLIDECINIFLTTDADSVIGVAETRACYGKIIEGCFKHLFPGQPRRRQDREPLYKESSTIYGTRTVTLLRNNSVLGDKLRPLVVSALEAIDINTLTDFNIAETLMKLKLSGEV